MLNEEQFEQLPMFLSARDIHDNFTHDDRIGPTSFYPDQKEESLEDLYRRKRESPERSYEDTEGRSYADVRADIAAHGVKEPVWVAVGKNRGKVLWDGHHRVAMQHAADPDRLMPVTWGSEF